MKASWKLLLIASLAVFSSPLFADIYIGAKTGVLEPEDISGFDVDDDNPVALQLGYSFGPFSLQGELYSTKNEVRNAGTDAELDVLGIYGVFRTPGFIYFMAKGGVVNGDVETNFGDFDDTSISYGIGLGLDFVDFIFVEAEYLQYDIEDVDIDFFGVSANIKF